MAFTLTEPHTESFLEGAFASLRDFFTTDSKLSQLDALMSLSDAELDKRGLKRKDLGQLVFGTGTWN